MYNKIKHGFTLAELMAVIIIISILAALSAGYYRRSVEQARFAEGLMDVSAIVEAINRLCVERRIQGVACDSNLRLTNLDIDISRTGMDEGGCGSEQCITSSFRITFDPLGDGTVVATRNGGTYNGAYSIQMRPHFVATDRDQIFCVGHTQTGQSFCESMGYTSCTEHKCIKPI